MTSLDYAAQSPRPSGAARAVLDAWRGITRVEIKGAFLFGCALFVYHFIVFFRGMFTKGVPLSSVGRGFVMEQVGAFILMLVLVATDRMTDGDARRRGPYAVAVVITATLYAPLQALLEQFGDPKFVWIEFVKAMLYTFFEWLVLAGVATFIYTDRRRERAAVARMRAAEIERAHAARRTLESRLQAMQARVEPQFLFNTLAQVRDLYRASTARGERMLDELIAYLRAAMPRMRDTSSTVGQEINLVRAYLGIVSLRLGERLEFHVEAPGDAADARMPPMMLLPLVDHAIAHGLADPRSTGSIRIRTEISKEKVRLKIVDSGVGFLPGSEDGSIADIRERLSTLYGSDASLVLRRTGPSATEAVLEIRYELLAAIEESASPSCVVAIE